MWRELWDRYSQGHFLCSATLHWVLKESRWTLRAEPRLASGLRLTYPPETGRGLLPNHGGRVMSHVHHYMEVLPKVPRRPPSGNELPHVLWGHHTCYTQCGCAFRDLDVSQEIWYSSQLQTREEKRHLVPSCHNQQWASDRIASDMLNRVFKNTTNSCLFHSSHTFSAKV